MDEGTKILATVDGKPRTISKSSIRRNLKLKDEVGISSLPDIELFENLTLMGYNILPNQKFSFQKGTPTEPHRTPSPEAQQTSPTATSSQSLPPVTTVTIPTDLEIATLKARIKHLEDRDGGDDDPSGEDATIKGRRLETWEEAVVWFPLLVQYFPLLLWLHPTQEGKIAKDTEIARIHAEEELQMMVDGLDRSNEMIAKHVHEYDQAAAELTIGEKIELINKLVKYQDHLASILKTVPVEFSNALVVQDNALIVQDRLGYDWSYIVQEELTEFALMAYTLGFDTVNMAFLFAEDTNSINEVNTANGVSTAAGHISFGQASSSSYIDDLMFSFFANQSNSPQLDDEDLEQIDHDDLKEMDLKWQVATLSMRVKRFYKKTRRKLNFNSKEPIVFDKTKTLLPQIRAEIREEFRTSSGPSNAGRNPPPVTIHTWLERFNKQKPHSFKKATA
nr:zinc finger, CCHC-type, retrotransposon Gag domain protein [Tanacetum cinerariifolium]